MRLRVALLLTILIAFPAAARAQFTPPTLPPGANYPQAPATPPPTAPATPAPPAMPPVPAEPPDTLPAPSPPPAKVDLRALLPKTSKLIIDGALDTRYRTANTGRKYQISVQNVELDLQDPLLVKNQQQGLLFLQVIGENPADVNGNGQSGDVRIGEAYLTYRLPILTQTDSSAYLKVGQFILPVGLLPVYDTHLQPIQSLYPSAIGERTDWGVGVEGRFYGLLDYKFAVTAGVGPDHAYIDPNRVVTFRLGRLFPTPYGTFNLGGSLLSGRLPVTEVDPLTGFAPVLPPSGRVRAVYGYEEKTRIVGDGQYTYRGVSARGEIMTGADQTHRILGYFIEGEYQFAPGLSVVGARSYFDYGIGGSTSGDNSVGLNLSYGDHFVIRTLYDETRDVPNSNIPSPLTPTVNGHLRHIFTVQVLLRF